MKIVNRNNTSFEIEKVLSCISTLEFTKAVRKILSILGYESKRMLDLSGCPFEFIEKFPYEKQNTLSEREFLEHVKSVKLVFQYTNEEIQSTQNVQYFDNDSFDKSEEKSFLFFAVELKEDTYPRGKYAKFTREINKRIQVAPTVVFFKNGEEKLTLSLVYRREHKRNVNRKILGDVFLLKEINPNNPHRAHIDILKELTIPELLSWIGKYNKPKNFDGLFEAWLGKLNIEELNAKFYHELFNWYEKAIEQSKFPVNSAENAAKEIQIIRLITRILFVWFIKEKGLVAEELFNECQISEYLNNYNKYKGDSYYRVVLQNLFFATLNIEIDKRGFGDENQTKLSTANYIYKSEMRFPDELLELFSQTPFINGGLFDCLDKFEFDESDENWLLIDCFSDCELIKKLVSIPNKLFFDCQYGLFPLLNKYKFTVEENTPVEKEVALDPELLGKVFENLLAAYNPETSETVRKSTGSYYTPRIVVDYMVEESLISVLEAKIVPTVGDIDFLRERLHYLFDYADAFDDAEELFTEDEIEQMMKAISELSVLDPAVGSGAFPMSVIHKLTLALKRLDPNNIHWQKLQKIRALHKLSNAFDMNKQQRDKIVQEISENFERYSNSSDYGRKLYLIQNSIFGVDIQSVACQIAKLRFFISLAIEQNVTTSSKNYGFKPLPNLETRFIVANSLIEISAKSEHTLFESDERLNICDEIQSIREDYFLANTLDEKHKCIDKEDQKRKELLRLLEKQKKEWLILKRTEIDNLVNNLPNEKHRIELRIKEENQLIEEETVVDKNLDSFRKIANWNPYDQNSKADFFDRKWMFGKEDGFDLVIGNPPYIPLQDNSGKLRKLYKPYGFKTLHGRGDIYQLFFEQGCQQLISKTGILCYLTSNSWLNAEYGKTTRYYFSSFHSPLCLLDIGKNVFEKTIVAVCILILRNGKQSNTFSATRLESLPENDRLPSNNEIESFVVPSGEKPWSILSPIEFQIKEKIEQIGTQLKEWDINIFRGITTGCNEAFIIDNETKEALIQKDSRSEEILKPILGGRNIKRYTYEWTGNWLIYARKGVNIEYYSAIYEYLLKHKVKLSKKSGANKWYELQSSPSDRNDALLSGDKIVWMDMTNTSRFTPVGQNIYCNNKCYFMSSNKNYYMCGVLNSKIINWYFSILAPTTGMGVSEWTIYIVKQLPVPHPSAKLEKSISELVMNIARMKDANKYSSTCEIENQLDKYIYKLFKLNQREIKFIEKQFTVNKRLIPLKSK